MVKHVIRELGSVLNLRHTDQLGHLRYVTIKLSCASDVVSHATPLNQKERGIWWPCVQQVVSAPENRVQPIRFKSLNLTPYLQHVHNYSWPCTFCSCPWHFFLQLLYSAWTTHCMQGHQTLRLRRLAHKNTSDVEYPSLLIHY